MIENELQHRVSKARLNEFQTALASLEPHLPKRALEVRQNALESLIEELQTQINAYQRLRNHQDAPDLSGLEDLGEDLIRARIASGLTHATLAARLGMKPQQIQRYESTRYASASLARVLEVARALQKH